MPFVSASDDTRLGVLGRAPEPPEQDPGLGSIIGAALREGNSIVSAAFRMNNSGHFSPMEGFNVVDYLKKDGNDFFLEQHGWKFVNARSPGETESIKSQIRMEEHDRETMHAAGGIGVVATMGAGLFSPEILLPGRVAINAFKGGLLFTRGAAEVGLAGGIGAGVQETVLQGTQLGRTASESAINVASATVLSALLGGTAVRFLSAEGRLPRVEAGLNHERARMEAHAKGAPDPASDALIAERNAVVTDRARTVATELTEKDFIQSGAGLGERAAIITPEGRIYEFPEAYGREGEYAGLGAHKRFADEVGGSDGYAVITAFGDKSAAISAKGPLTPGQARAVARLQAAVRRNPEFELVTDFPEPAAPVATVSRETLPDGGAGAVSASLSAAATDTRQLRLAGAFGLEKMRDTPIAKALNASVVEARRIATDLAETVLRFGSEVAERDANGNLTGRTIKIAERAGEGPALSRLASLYENQARVAVGEKMDELWKGLRFEGEKAPWFAKMRDWMGQLPNPAKLPTFDEFSELVARAMRNDDRSDIPQVAQAAQFIRERVFEPWKQRAIDAGIFGPDVDVKTAESYFQRIYNKKAINDNPGAFVSIIQDWLRRDQDTKRAAQERIGFERAQLRSWEQQIKGLEGRLERLDVTRGKLAARFDERAQEVGRTEKRTGILDERATEIAEELSDVSEFIAAAREQISDPRMLERLADMEKEVSELRKMDRPMTEAQLRKVEEDELKGILADPTTRMAAEIITGRRKPPKAPSFLSWLVMSGGLKDVGGDLRSVMGNQRARPGLINSRGREFDDMGIKIQGEFPEQFPSRDVTGGGAPDRDDILGWIEDAFRGKEPDWWMDSMTRDKKELVDAGRLANAMDEALSRAGVEPKSIRDVAKILRDDQRAPISLNDLDRITREMEDVGQDIPVSGRRAAAEENLVVEREDIARLRAVIDQARRDRARGEVNLRVAEARTGEAAFAERQNKGRLGLIDERMDRADRRRELIEDMLTSAGRERDAVRAKIEAELLAWEGKSADEAKAAIKAREKYAAGKEPEQRTRIGQRPGESAQFQTEAAGGGRAPSAARLTSADSAVDATVNRILDRPTDFTPEELRKRAIEIKQHILGSPDGRLPYNEAMGHEAGFVAGGEPPRGPLSERVFNIDDREIEEFLENNVEHVVNSHLRTIVPDILLTERFGDPKMTRAFKEIEDAYGALIDKTNDPTIRAKLIKEQESVTTAIAGMRDRIRGVYGLDQYNALNGAARIAQAAKNYNVITSMGMATITSFADMAGAVFRFGLGTVFREGYAPFLRMLMKDGGEWAEASRQFKAMGIANEMVSASRHRNINEIMDNMRPQSRLERTLQYGADKMQLANMLAPWTDWAKTTVSIIASNDILRAAKAVTEGTATRRQLDALADSRISPEMATRIWGEFSRKDAGEIINGTHLPNTDRWVSQEARLAFEGAVAREAEIAVVTPGQEKYLWLSNPLVSVIGQFKSFMVSATTRILIANLQRYDAYTLQGLIFSMGLGMMSYKLNSVLGGQPTSDKPGDWIKEGISRSGMLGWFEEANALAGKMSRGRVDMYRLVGSDKPLSRYAGRSVLDQMLGPTAGKLDRLQRITGALAAGDWNANDTHATRQLVAYQNAFWLRGVLNQVEEGANGAFGIPENPPKKN